MSSQEMEGAWEREGTHRDEWGGAGMEEADEVDRKLAKGLEDKGDTL